MCICGSSRDCQERSSAVCRASLPCCSLLNTQADFNFIWHMANFLCTKVSQLLKYCHGEELRKRKIMCTNTEQGSRSEKAKVDSSQMVLACSDYNQLSDVQVALRLFVCSTCSIQAGECRAPSRDQNVQEDWE